MGKGEFTMARINAKKPASGGGLIEVFTPFITIKGKRVYRKNGSVFHFWAKPRSK